MSYLTRRNDALARRMRRIFTVTVALAIGVVIAFITRDIALREWRLIQLEYMSGQSQQNALNWLTHHLPDNPGLQQRIANMMLRHTPAETSTPAPPEDAPPLFDQLIRAARQSNTWSLENFGPAWLEAILGRYNQLNTDLHARLGTDLGRFVASDSHWLDDPRLIERVQRLFNRLIAHDEPEVRYAGMIGLAMWTQQYPQQFTFPRSLIEDSALTIREHAWLMLGAMDEQHITPMLDDTFVMPEAWAVARAKLYAYARHDAWEAVMPAIVDESELPDAVRTFLPYAMGVAERDEPVALWQQWLAGPITLNEPMMLRTWRAVLAIPALSESQAAPLAERIAMNWQENLAAALVHRKPSLASQLLDRPRPNALLVELAGLLAVEPGTIDATFEDDESMPMVLRIARVRAMQGVEVEHLLPAFSSEHATLRNWAAMVAADRFNDAQQQELVETLARRFDDTMRGEAGIMLGLTGKGRKAVIDRLEGHLDAGVYRESQWPVEQQMRMGLMMLDPDESGITRYRMLGLQRRLPLTTTLLARLHVGDRKALDDLFNPMGDELEFQIDPDDETTVTLRELLHRHLFWLVLRAYLPRDWADDFDLWADVDLQQFQIDVLRERYLLHRASMRFDTQQRRFTVNHD